MEMYTRRFEERDLYTVTDNTTDCGSVKCRDITEKNYKNM